MNDFTMNRSNVSDDDLDARLRAWHDEHADRARAGRDQLLRTLASREAGAKPRGEARAMPARSRLVIARIFFSPHMRAAASLVLVAFIALMFLPRSVQRAHAEVIQVAQGGKLEARDDRGNLLGPVPLQHTDVDVRIAGLFTRVTVRQQYANPYDTKIEAVYTFPLSHRAAVDRMRMTIGGDRVIEGEVKEREEARQIYEQARAANHVASLLEQERPNIFTQSIANIEPGEAIDIEISYIETLESKDGVFTFAFPMTVAPRYIPGSSTVSPALVPAELTVRRGVTLLGPAEFEILRVDRGDDAPAENRVVSAAQIRAMLSAATPIEYPGELWWGKDAETGQVNAAPILTQFTATYADSSAEGGAILEDGTGQIGGRWFFTDPEIADAQATGFAQNTNQVPDASRITPMPVHPSTRAGHDISVTVSIDTGGPELTMIESELHEIVEKRADGGRAITLELANSREIPNRDFVLNWKQADGAIEEATFAHADERGGFFTLVLAPPRRVEAEIVRPRELIFVLDTSGSMGGQPIEKAKSVLTRAIEQMRDGDTFNIITFAGHTDILWELPRANTDANRTEALNWVNAQQGSGGTEMMTAIEAALKPVRAAEPSDADPVRIVMFLTDGEVGNDMAIIDTVKKYADTTRVFSFGIGNSVNRYLLANMAHAARGEVEFVTQESDPDGAVERFVKRIDSPILTDITLEFSDGVVVSDLLPVNQAGLIPDLYDRKPLIIHGRFDPTAAREGTATIRGRTNLGDYERTVDLSLADGKGPHDQIATLWARAKVDELMNADLTGVQLGNLTPDQKNAIVSVGVEYQIMSQFTSFVAVEKSRVTVEGVPMLVTVPTELPSDASWEGFFGPAGEVKDDIIELTMQSMDVNIAVTALPQAPDHVERLRRIVAAAPADLPIELQQSVDLLKDARVTDARKQVAAARAKIAADRATMAEDDFVEFNKRADEMLLVLEEAERLNTVSTTAVRSMSLDTLQRAEQQQLSQTQRNSTQAEVLHREAATRDAGRALDRARSTVSTVSPAPKPERFGEVRVRLNAPMLDEAQGLSRASGLNRVDRRQGTDGLTSQLAILHAGSERTPFDAGARHADTNAKSFGLVDSLGLIEGDFAGAVVGEMVDFEHEGMFFLGDSFDNQAAPVAHYRYYGEPANLGAVYLNYSDPKGFSGMEAITFQAAMGGDGAGERFEGVVTVPAGVALGRTASRGFLPAQNGVRYDADALWAYAESMQETYKDEDVRGWGADNYGAWHENFLKEAVVTLYEQGDVDAAGKFYQQLDSYYGLGNVPPNTRYETPIEDFVAGYEVKTETASTSVPIRPLTLPQSVDVVVRSAAAHAMRPVGTVGLEALVRLASPHVPSFDLADVTPLMILRGRIDRLAELDVVDLDGPRLVHLFPPTGSFYLERIVMFISELVEQGQLDVAATITQWLVDLDSSYEAAQELKAAFEGKEVDDAARIAMVTAIARGEEQSIRDVIRDRIIAKRLEQAIHPELLARIQNDQTPADGVRVTLKLNTNDAAATEAIRSAGFTAEGVSDDGTIVVGSADARVLRRVALLPEVVRIVEVDMKPAH